MQGYYCYTIYGTKRELKQFNEKLEEIADTNEILDSLNDWKTLEYLKNHKMDDETKIDLGTYAGSTNISGCNFANSVEEVMEILAEKFPEYEIRGEGYLLDYYNSRELYKSDKGSSEYYFVDDGQDVGLDCNLEHYYSDTDEFELDDGWENYCGIGRISADVFRNEDGIITMESATQSFDNPSEVISEYNDSPYAGKGAVVELYVYDHLFETNFDYYNEESDIFVLLDDRKEETENFIPGSFFRNKKDDFESKQILYSEDGKKYILVHLIADDKQLEKVNNKKNNLIQKTDQKKARKKVQDCLEFSKKEHSSFKEKVVCGKFKGVVTEADVVIPNEYRKQPVKVFKLGELPTLIKSLEIPSNLKIIDGLNEEKLFEKSSYKLETIIIDSKNRYFWTDGKAIFSKNKKRIIRFMAYNDSEYTIPEGTEIISEYCFCGLDNLERVILPKTITKIESKAFSKCSKLNNLEGLKNLTRIKSCDSLGYACIEDTPFYSNNDEIIIGSVFYKNTNTDKKRIVVPKGITSIYGFGLNYRWYNGDHMYEKTESDILEEVVLPDSLTEIANDAFSNRYKLKKLVIPNNVKKIGGGAFGKCFSLKSIYIPASVEKIDGNPFPCDNGWYAYMCKDVLFKSVEVDSNNKQYCSENGILYSKDKKVLLHIPAKAVKGTLTIPKEVEVIAYDLFGYNRYEAVDAIEFEEGSHLKIIDDNVFSVTFGGEEEHSGFDSISIPEGTQEIGRDVFKCFRIGKVSLPKSLKKIGECAFGSAEEIELYDTIDPRGGDAYDIKKTWGIPDTMASSIGQRVNKWNDHTLTVKDSKTDKIKWKVWMGASGTDREYGEITLFGWGRKGTFAFKKQDEWFKKLKIKKHKLKIAEYRLMYPVDLSDEAKEEYVNYLKRYSDNAEEILKNAELLEENAPKKKTATKKMIARKELIIKEEKDDKEKENRIFKELKDEYSNDVVKVFKKEYKKAKEMCKDILVSLQEMDYSKIETADSYVAEIKKCLKEIGKYYAVEEFSRTIHFINEGTKFEIEVNLPRIVYEDRDEYDAPKFSDFKISHVRKKIDKNKFNASKFHEDLFYKLEEANVQLLENLSKRAMSLADYGDILRAKKTLKYYKYFSADFNGNGWQLKETMNKEFIDRIENVKKGDTVELELVPSGYSYSLAVKTSDGCIGFLPDFVSDFYREIPEYNDFKISGKISKVIPKSKLEARARKPIVEVKIEVKKVK